MTKTAILFTGQGSQFQGMGKDFYEKFPIAKNIFETFNRILDKDITRLCFNSGEDELKQTVNSQPCILAVELAILESLKASCNINIDYVAGHSLGEYAALYCANVIDLATTIKLIQARANAMDKVKIGSMSAILGKISIEKLQELINSVCDLGYVDIANYNTPEQTVITGENVAVTKVSELALQNGAKRAIPLAVSGAFHSKLMKMSAEEFKPVVEACALSDAKIPIITNVDAKPTVKKEEFKEKMIAQVYSSVQWVQTLNYLFSQGVTNYIEIGPKAIVSGLIRKTLQDVNTLAICKIEDLDKFINKGV